MAFSAAILHGKWHPVEVSEGGYIVLLTPNPEASLEGRFLGLHLKDTLLVLGPGRAVSFAFLFRQPFEGTLVENVLAHGTGVMNINGSRVKADLSEFFSATGKPRSGMGHARGYGMGDGYGGDKANPPNAAGRWPTNMAFVHMAGCRRVGSRKVSTGVAHRSKSGGKTFGGSVDKPPMSDMTYADADGKETIPTYECEPGCLVAALDTQSGERPSTLTGRADPTLQHEHPSSAKTDSWFSGGAAKDSQVYADSGGASRFYPQFPNIEELSAWVRGLIAKDSDKVFEL